MVAVMVLTSLAATGSPAQASLWSQCAYGRICLFTSYYGENSDWAWCHYGGAQVKDNNGVRMPPVCNNNTKSWFNNTNIPITLIDGDGCNAQTPYWRRTLQPGQKADGRGSDWINRISSINWAYAPYDGCGI